jgi:hypothetical protein
MLATLLFGCAGLMIVPFFLAGGLWIVYNLLLSRACSTSDSEKKV